MNPQDIVKQHIAHGKMAHAYCLLGPLATTDQKAVFIHEIAKLLEVPVHALSFFGTEDAISIDDIRRIGQIASLAAGAHPQIIALRNADTLSHAAANAFLKTLEEPSSGTIFFLLASSHAALLPTILSRVWTVRFNAQHSMSDSSRSLNVGRVLTYTIAEKLAKQDDHGKQFVADFIAELRAEIYNKKPASAQRASAGKNVANILPHAVEAYELLHYPGAPYRLILDTLASALS